MICLMEIKISLNQLIIIGFLAVLYQFFFIKAFYLLFLPGLFFLVLFTDFDFLKALAFSLPVSLILYVLPYFVITRAGLPVNYVFYLLIPLFMLIYLLVTKRFTFSYSKKFNLVNIVLLIILLSAVSYVYSPYSYRDALPLTAGSNLFYSIKTVADSVRSSGLIPSYSDNLFSGMHYFFTYPPLTQLSVAFLSLIPTEVAFKSYNFTFSFLVFYLLFTSYIFLRKFSLSPIACFVGLFSLAGLPFIAGELTYSGNVSSIFMYSQYPLVLFGLFSLFDKVKKSELVVYAITYAGLFLAYHYISYFMTLSIIATVAIYFFFTKSKKLLVKNYFIYFVIAGLLIMSWFIRYMLTSDFIILSEREAYWNLPLKSISEFVSLITSSSTDPDIYHRIITFTPVFFYVGVFASFAVVRLSGKKFSFKRDDLLMLSYTLFIIFLMVVEIWPFHTLLPLRDHYYVAYRYWFVLAPLLMFGIARLADNLISFDKKSTLLVIIASILLFSGMYHESAVNVDAWLNERAILDRSLFGAVYNIIDPSFGRVAVYGSFGPAVVPAVSNWTGASMFAGYNFQRHVTNNYYHNIIQPFTEASMDYLKANVSANRLHNSYMNSFTNMLLFFTCDEKGFDALNKTIDGVDYRLAVDVDCFVALSPITPSVFSEMVVLSNASKEVINSVMDSVDGYKLVFAQGDYNYTNFVTSNNVGSYVTDSTPVLFNKVSDTEYFFKPLSAGYLLVKLAYFPTWHAYQDGHELSVFSSYHGFTIIKSESASNIHFVVKPHYSELIGLLFLVLGVISCLYAFW